MARSRVTQFDVIGLADLRRRLDFDRYEPALEGLVATVTDYVETEARRRTKRRTGRLSSGWTSSHRALHGEAVNRVPYASFVDRGTRKMAPRPIVKPTIGSARRQMRAASKKADELIERLFQR